MTMPPDDVLRQRAQKLGLYGLLANWDDVVREDWLNTVLTLEEVERQRRSLERRLRTARLGRFKPIADFDWGWPTKIDREAIDDLFNLRFVAEAANAVFVGPNGIGKSMIAKNLAHHAVLNGYTVRFTTASAMLNDLAAQEGATALKRAFRRYCQPHLLVVDEVGYLSYDNRYADLLFEVVTRRYTERSIAITTNKPFKEWNEVFPNASCVVTLVDRLVHNAEVVEIDGESYRLKEAKERTAKRKKERAKRNKKPC